MALSVPTVLGGASSGAAAGSIVSGVLAPSSGALLVMFARCEDDLSASAPTVTTTLANVGAWTVVTPIYSGATIPGTVFAAWALITGAPGTGTITLTFGGSHINRIMTVSEFTGHNTSSPMTQTLSGVPSTTGTTYSQSFASPLAASSCAMAGLVTQRAVGNITPGAGFTALTDQVVGSTRALYTEYDLTSAAQAVAVGGLTNGNARVLIAFEVAEAVTHIDVTIADVFAFVDTETDLLGHIVTDPFGLTDTQTAALGAAITDPFGMSDSAASALGATIGDGFGVGDDVGTALAVTITDPFAASDVVTAAAAVIAGLILCAEIVITPAVAAVTLSAGDAEVVVAVPSAAVTITQC